MANRPFPPRALLLAREERVRRVVWIGCVSAPKTPQTCLVAGRDHVRHVHFATPQLVQFLHRYLRGRIRRRRNRKAYQGLVEIQRRVADFEDILLHVRHRLDDVRPDQRYLRRYAGKRLHGVDYSRRRRMHLVGILAGHDASVMELALRLNAYALTNDKGLRAKLRKAGVPLIYLRSGTHLVVEGRPLR